MIIYLKEARTYRGKKHKIGDAIDVHRSLADIYIQNGFATTTKPAVKKRKKGKGKGE